MQRLCSLEVCYIFCNLSMKIAQVVVFVVRVRNVAMF